jgi:hypothetical protein
MIRRTVVGFARDEQAPEVEEHLLDADLVVFGSGRGAGRGRWASALALRLSSGGDAALLSHRADGLALVAGVDDEATLEAALAMPDPCVVVVLAEERGTVRAGLNGRDDEWRFLLLDLASSVVGKATLIPAKLGPHEVVEVSLHTVTPFPGATVEPAAEPECDLLSEPPPEIVVPPEILLADAGTPELVLPSVAGNEDEPVPVDEVEETLDGEEQAT